METYSILHAKKLWEGGIVDHSRKLMVGRAGQQLKSAIFFLDSKLNLGEQLLSLHTLLRRAELCRCDLMRSEFIHSPVRPQPQLS